MNTSRLYIANLINKVLPTSRCMSLKSRIYRWAGVKVGKNVEIFSGAQIFGAGEVQIGDNCFIGIDAKIMTNAGSSVIIEDYGMVGHDATIVTGFHPITPEGPRIIGYEGTSSTCRICRGASLGLGATLLPGKTLGEMSHAAAKSLVTHDVPPYTRVGGVPARIIKEFVEP